MADLQLASEFSPLRHSARITLWQHSYPGRLITLDGVDGSGKSTSLSVIRDYASSVGVRTELVKMPSPQARALQYFRAYADDHSVAFRGGVNLPALCLVLLGDRLLTTRQHVLPGLARGDWILCDRYIYTTLAELVAVGCSEADMRALRAVVELFPCPDLAVIADVTADESIKRIRARPDEKESLVHRGIVELYIRGFQKVALDNGLSLLPTERGLAHCASVLRGYASRLREGVSVVPDASSDSPA